MNIMKFVEWFSGGHDGYMNLIHCMNHDYFWIVVTVVLDIAVAVGYGMIALHWRRNELLLRDSPVKSALANMKRIFVICGICGYIFTPVKMFWPAWRLYDLFVAALVYYTWTYALRSRELRVVYTELGRSDELASHLEQARDESRRKSEFLNAISHDLKTPLTGLMLQAELASIHLGHSDSEGVQETLDQIKACARTTNDLLDHLIEVGRLELSDSLVHAKLFEVDELLHSLVDQFSSRAREKGLSIDVKLPTNLKIMTDRIILKRILSNLIDNAIKHTRQGTIEITATSKDSVISFHVIDSGEGIAPEDHGRIFDDFTQLGNEERDSRKGFGLGLAISRRLADRLGAKLSLESRLDVGSQFGVHFPTLEKPQAAAASSR